MCNATLPRNRKKGSRSRLGKDGGLEAPEGGTAPHTLLGPDDEYPVAVRIPARLPGLEPTETATALLRGSIVGRPESTRGLRRRAAKSL